MAGGLVLPDVIGGIITILRADADVTALAGPRISVQLPAANAKARDWVMPNYAVLVRRAGGPSAFEWEQVGRRVARIDVRCYGAGTTPGVRARTAEQLWRTVDPVLSPPHGLGLPARFRVGSLGIDFIRRESDPIPLIEPDTTWDLVLCSYLVTYMTQALS